MALSVPVHRMRHTGTGWVFLHKKIHAWKTFLVKQLYFLPSTVAAESISNQISHWLKFYDMLKFTFHGFQCACTVSEHWHTKKCSQLTYHKHNVHLSTETKMYAYFSIEEIFLFYCMTHGCWPVMGWTVCMDIVPLLLVELCFVQFLGQRTVKDCIHIVMGDGDITHTWNCIIIFCYFKLWVKKSGTCSKINITLGKNKMFAVT